MMSNDFKILQNKWEENKINLSNSKLEIEKIFERISNKEKENFKFYYGTIIILVSTLISISLFFYYVAPVKQLMSRIGVSLMISGLIFRIIIEIFSIKNIKKIKKSDDTLKSTESSIKFHEFRKKIHNTIAPVIVALYTVGFYMITPEFSLYIDLPYLILIDVSYLIIGIILFIVIRKGVKKEVRKVEEIIQLKKDLLE